MRIAVFLVVLAGSRALAAEPPELKPFEFLIGEWSSAGGGQPGAGTGIARFARSLQDRVILRTSYSEYPATDGKPASRHDDLMVIYAVPGVGARADFYDNEGHVIHYVVHSPEPGCTIFLSETAETGPRFRLSYKLEASGVLKGEFAIAPPTARETFAPYLTWESRMVPRPPR